MDNYKKLIDIIKEYKKTEFWKIISGDDFFKIKDKEDIFVHYSQIKEKGYKALNTGDEVTFTMFETKNGLQAKDVTKVLSR